MNGFLRRLAARATGQATPIHAAAISPYTASAIPWVEALPLREEASVAPGAEPGARALSRVPAAVVQALSRPDTPDVDGVPVSVPARRMSTQDAIHAEPQLAAPPGAAPSAATPPDAVAPSAWRDAIRLARASTVGPAAQDAHQRSFHEKALMPAAHRQDELSEFGPASATTPEPLLPFSPLPAMSPSGAPFAPALVRQARLGTLVEETTEVHVSIGRIEITAMHETPAPRRPAPHANKPMSLDEYLAKREAGRS